MSLQERKEAAVRAVFDRAPRPVVPPGLCAEAMRRGERTLRRRRTARRVLWCVLLAAVAAFTVWAAVARPWEEPPARTTPPLTGW
ncbi:hypothetical protein [Streptomyces beihaiensis]|uniref:DUF3040 domain-containing protein n=1 Tax=Streptomyces beihaiensis TaxID=2984495 RepID=A0ABT3TTP4_9ACTN|nr:hypothetical protein [Streptomyces beihaiensis]MCX3059455.1 hypothetical protein [Streptomyces beihaiensis]